jgi:hypothetical protein
MRDDSHATVRTTLDIDDDILQAAKELASARRLTIGKVVSDLARRGLVQPAGDHARVRNGVPLLEPRRPGEPRPTMRLVNELRERE